MLSIAFLSYNRSGYLDYTLKHFFESSILPQEYEIFISDDGSNEVHAPLISKIAKKYNIELLSNEHGGQSKNLNKTIKHCKYDNIMLVEDDWQLIKKLDLTHALSMLCGAIKEILFPITLKPFGRSSTVVSNETTYTVLCSKYGVINTPLELWNFSLNPCIVNKQLFSDLGLFDECVNCPEVEFVNKYNEKGYATLVYGDYFKHFGGVSAHADKHIFDSHDIGVPVIYVE
jgi:glycosyltransferase involved in cell wall biosynthesis